MPPRLIILAHDVHKPTLVEWCRKRKVVLARCELHATGSSAKLLKDQVGLSATATIGGAKGGDLLLAARVMTGDIDAVVLFANPNPACPHDLEVLQRACILRDVPICVNAATADLLFNTDDEYVGRRAAKL